MLPGQTFPNLERDLSAIIIVAAHYWAGHRKFRSVVDSMETVCLPISHIAVRLIGQAIGVLKILMRRPDNIWR
jgi:hypothetical protein